MKDQQLRLKIPWPTKDVMQQVYERGLWGRNTSEFYSGEGSHDPELVMPYVEVVSSFLNSFETPLKVCDLGCGDFNIGKDLVKFTGSYIAIDIVEDLILFNKKHFNADHLEFGCLDIAVDELPAGDCVILRQVLQHLSNVEITQILAKLSDFKYVILTEHIPSGSFIPNKDLISGQGIRLKKQSGVNVLAPPFSFQVKDHQTLVSVVPKDGKGIVVTTLYTVF
ncbi:class I SAM-dependent methyltransferase [Gelidibacter salicanalis]|uniref:Class I SAM-dependent methyltransferase n=1 Tax=Gelidibacter salicanalis TaxID=291193 RepID=A0A5C7AF07_9FLAO|nr:class I SAM-dependent methyltransferase [Gelidibacter salicanalis]TXE07346.1 class I SAM-dependent methyltransferase [Gelidibacter salicanalis]